MDSLPSASDVATYLDWTEADLRQIDAHLRLVTAMARSYTRGAGFLDDDECEEDIAAVLITATARSVSNPTNATRVEVGSYSELPARFDGWTLIEQHVLHSYRRRTA